MKLYMKQKALSWNDRFFIKDEDGVDVYYAEGVFLTWAKKLNITDKDGNPVAYIHQKLASLNPCYIIEVNGKEVCSLFKKVSLLSPNYRVTGLPWVVTGNISEHEYSITEEGGRSIMRMRKHFLTWGDSYELDIADQNDALACLCITIAIDCITT